ncbi:cyclase [Natrarchaeobius halalkaliphilus]|uniref:Cyclase n=1 Tax=Natrarchaeobius halalkaliphilus TaxID=1679091 RepID=A0A3N6LZ30_9EURY|nr:SRPBCC family protein [Natrarchaeobius halalkaliphilus]RQG87012.1 cyclase [Natrarchaeobius halalkaliphilus]
MPSYDRRTIIDAPLQDVWQFYSRASGLEDVTPDWVDLRVESVIGSDGRLGPDVLEPGSELSVSIRPFGLGPRQYWLSVITERERADGAAYFRDELEHGPFDEWVHTHSFFAHGDRTVLRDEIEYELPLGPLARFGRPFSRIGFEAMFRARHRLTNEQLG